MPPSDAPDGRSQPGDFAVGAWIALPSRNLLINGDEQIRVEPRVMDVLVHLAAHADRLVSKEELIARVWSNRYVTDDVLTVTIYALRKALGDDARRPRYIETVSRRGYRLVADVTPRELISDRRYGLPGVSWSMRAAMAVLAIVVPAAIWAATLALHRRHVPPPEAHEAYLKGRYFLDQRSMRGLQQARDQFERAVALDPQDPAAHAGLADTYSAMSDFGVASPATMRPRAMQEVRRALELDARSAEALEALGRLQFLFDWDFAAAERSLTQAIGRDPDYMPSYQAMAWVKSARGQHAESVAAARRALQLDPVNQARYTELAWVLALGGRHEEALHEIDRALQLNPQSLETYLMKGWTTELAGQPDAAFAAYREASRIAGASEELLGSLEAIYRAEGLAGYYRGYLNRRGSGPLSDFSRAQLYVRAGELNRAIESLERAYQKREGALAWVNVEPGFQPLRSDERFQQIAARVAHQQ